MESALEHSEIPRGRRGQMGDISYNKAGWFAITNAFMSTIYMVAFFGAGRAIGNLILMGIILLQIYLTVNVLKSIRLFLIDRYMITDTSAFIDLMMYAFIILKSFAIIFWIAILFDGLDFLPRFFLVIGSYLGFGMMPFTFVDPYGIFLVILSIKLLKHYDSIDKLMRIYAYITLAWGILAVAFVWHIAILASIGSYILLGIIFRRQTGPVEFV